MKERQNNSDGVAMPHLRCSWDRPQVMRGAVKRWKPHHRNVVGRVPDGDFVAEVTSLTPYFCQRSLREQRRRDQTRVAAGSSSQLQTVDTSDRMVPIGWFDLRKEMCRITGQSQRAFRGGQTWRKCWSCNWPEPMSFLRRSDVDRAW